MPRVPLHLPASLCSAGDVKAGSRKLSEGSVQQAPSPFSAPSPMPGPVGDDQDTPRALASSCSHSSFSFAATAKLPSARQGREEKGLGC